MGSPEKTVEDLILELQVLTKEHEELKKLYRLGTTEQKYAELIMFIQKSLSIQN